VYWNIHVVRQNNLIMSFFIKKGHSGFKRNSFNSKPEKQQPKEKKKRSYEDEISSHSEDENDDSKVYSDVEEDEETVQEKRLRIAKEHIRHIETQELRRTEDADVAKSLIAHRLKEDILEKAGKLCRTVADLYNSPDVTQIKHLRCKDHKRPITCVVVSPDCQTLYSSSKDCSIVKWSLTEMKKVTCLKRIDKKSPASVKGHRSAVQCLSISSDGKFLASGDLDKDIHVWNPVTMEWLYTFRGHRGGVTGLVFQKGTNILYSVSMDRALKVWNLNEMAFVENFFGHQDTITSIDTMTKERVTTSGGRDGSIRIWKIQEDSQLLFNGHGGSIDCVRLVNEDHFVSCGDDGTLSLWGCMKKKPLCIVTAAHGVSAINNEPNWISAVATLQNTDLVASGSRDGFIRVWKCGDGFRSLTELFSIPAIGFINSLNFSSDGKMLIAGVGQEHRLGRWWREASAKNEILIIPLTQKEPC